MAEMPILFREPQDCCGCTACYAICPANAIRMMPDGQGFLYPEIDEAKCIGCRRCVGVCPIKTADKGETVWRR